MLSYTALQPLCKSFSQSNDVVVQSCLILTLDGRISDAFGRKSALLFAAIIFFIGSFLCGAANSLWSLVIARGIAGIGGGGLNTVSCPKSPNSLTDKENLDELGDYE